MLENFTDRARKVMSLASTEATRYGHPYIGSEHILLGLVKEGSGVGAVVLMNFGADIKQLRRQVEKLVGNVRLAPGRGTVRLPHAPSAKKVVEYATEEARILNYRYVGTEAILLALLRESDGVAAQALKNLGLTLENIRQEVLDLLTSGDKAPIEPDTGALCEGNDIDIYIDAGHASKDTIQEVLAALSDFHVAAGGLGLEFKNDGYRVRAAERVAK